MSLYHYHIRKTGGTTINFSFLRTVSNNPAELYSKIASSPGHYMNVDGKYFSGWNQSVINSGNYFYSWSHIPFHQLRVPVSVDTLTCFRDPIKRLISHYNMINNFKINDINHPCMRTEGKWLGNNVIEFASNLPKEHLKNQLWMFSSKFNINEALDNISKVDYILYNESLDKDLLKLFSKLELDFKENFKEKS